MTYLAGRLCAASRIALSSSSVGSARLGVLAAAPGGIHAMEDIIAAGRAWPPAHWPPAGSPAPGDRGTRRRYQCQQTSYLNV